LKVSVIVAGTPLTGSRQTGNCCRVSLFPLGQTPLATFVRGNVNADDGAEDGGDDVGKTALDVA
jgi:hypothetical protein